MEFERIMKILDYCASGACENCPYEDRFFNCDMVMSEASSLLKEQKALIESLMKVNDDHCALNGKLRKELDNSKFSYIYLVEQEPGGEREFFQYHSDALKYARGCIEEVANDDDWDVEDLENALEDIADSDVCPGVVRIEVIEVK